MKHSPFVTCEHCGRMFQPTPDKDGIVRCPRCKKPADEAPTKADGK